MLRTGRKGLAAATLLLDAAKGAAAVLIGAHVAGDDGRARRRAGRRLGHLFPVWLGFKGGKGVATGLGVLLAAAPLAGLAAALVWLGTALLTRISSASALAACVAAPVIGALLGTPWPVEALVMVTAALIVGRHHANIRRLLAGTEPRIGGREMSDDLDRLRLARTEGVGPLTYRRLLRRYGSAAAALDALPGLARAGGRATGPAIPGRDDAERELEQAGRARAALLFVDTPGYPTLLGLLEDAPPVLAVQGRPGRAGPARRWPWWAAATPRPTASAWPRRWPRTSPPPGWWWSPAWRAASTRRRMRARCAPARRSPAWPAASTCPTRPSTPICRRASPARGAVVAEAPPGTAPQARHFPRRNRIIAGLSLGVVVVEAALRSGSLITARQAQEAGREVFAVPGSPLDPRCRGANDLIRQGARLAETAADVLADLPEHPGEGAAAAGRCSAARGLRGAAGAGARAAGRPDRVRAPRASTWSRLLGPSPTPVDDLIRRCQLCRRAR